MGRQSIKWFTLLALGLGLTGAAILRFGITRPETAPVAAKPPNPAVALQTEVRPVHLYFGEVGLKHLRAEERSVQGVTEPQALAEVIVQGLIKGPRTARNVVSLLPDETGVNGVFLDGQGTAHVDLNWPSPTQRGTSSRVEMLQLYGIVNSLVLNVDEVRKVQLLKNGQPATTLAGHMDISRALGADMMLVR